MSKKPAPFIPIESLKTQRVEVYINDLQKELHRLRSKYDTIFMQCCDIQKKIQEVSSESMTRQQEIGKIISEFEELRLSNVGSDNVLSNGFAQKAGDVRRLRDKFETRFQENPPEFIVQAENSLQSRLEGEPSSNPQTSFAKPLTAITDEQNSEMWSTFESFYSFSSSQMQDKPESLCLEKDEVAEAID